MIGSNAITVATLLLASTSSAQLFLHGSRSKDAYTWIQPEDTVIYTQNGDAEPVYPSPRTSGAGGWEDALKKARDFVAELTLQEKADMVTGQTGPCTGNIYPIPRLNFSGLCFQDGPSSLRMGDYVSVFPAGVTIASSWDRKMMYDRGLALGREFRGKGAHVALGPSAGPLGRSAYSGRNWEGFSPDPYLSGIAMEESILEFKTPANPFLDENGTLQYEAISSNVDDRTVHELYMWPFANAVHAGVASVMCSYQRTNGSYGCQNSKLMNGLLKEELGFQGYVVSDWLAVHAGMASIEAGLDMDMPGFGRTKYVINETRSYNSFFGGNITTGVNNGTLSQDRLDDMILRIMTPYYALHQDDDFPTVDPSSSRLNTYFPPSTWLRPWNLTGPESRDVRGKHGEMIRKHAAASTILLKNLDGALPLKAPKKIGVYGNDAADGTEGALNQGRFEFGTLATGGGSGAGQFSYLITPLEALKARAVQDHALLEFRLNNTLTAGLDPESQNNTPLPHSPDVCLVFLKGWAREGSDRESLYLDDHSSETVEAVAGSCNNTVVITHSSGINLLDWADHPNVTAILLAHYPGQESGNSIVDVLYGHINPSGRLPYTIAYNASDYNYAPITTNINTIGVEDWQSSFDEKLHIDYRHYDASNIDVRYEFGYGLSYTDFELSKFTVKISSEEAEIPSYPSDNETRPGGNPALWETIYTAQVTVRNTGDVSGAAIPQLYVAYPQDGAPEGTPLRQLRGFDKVELAPGKHARVEFPLMRRDLSYWDVNAQKWAIPQGEFKFHVVFSSRNLVKTKSQVIVKRS
ncbi:beta-glucosidase-related glycosidase [Ilyonectria destructans]|nr:beta-glucosidase-related glycosidase [Ilyonectria destructans]